VATLEGALPSEIQHNPGLRADVDVATHFSDAVTHRNAEQRPKSPEVRPASHGGKVIERLEIHNKERKVSQPFEMVFVLYPKVAVLDFTGPFEVFFKVPNARIRLVSPEGGDLQVKPGFKLQGLERLGDIERCDLLFVPGGMDHPGGPEDSVMATPDVVADLRRLADGAKYVTSVCNGSLILARAGVLNGRRSACHWLQLHMLESFGAIPDPARVVRDGKFISGGGVTAGIDFALVVAAEIAGETYARSIQLMMEYAPEPPFGLGRPELASQEVLDCFRAAFGPGVGAIGGVIPETSSC
jgi:cyclohexyl-isocyanide hydratase